MIMRRSLDFVFTPLGMTSLVVTCYAKRSFLFLTHNFPFFDEPSAGLDPVSSASLDELILKIREATGATILVVTHELESIFRSRNEDSHESTRKVISLLLQELDGIQKHDHNLLLIGATNTPHLLDEAFLRTGRLDVQIFVGLPDVAARQQILENCFKDVTYPVQKGLLAAVAAYTADYSGADLKGLAIKVKQLAFLRKTTYYSKELFEECLSDFRPAPCSQIIQQIREWEARWGR